MPALGSVVVVVNPAATRARRELRSELARALAGHGLAGVLVTRGPGEAGPLAARAAADGAAVVVAVGGDGTASQVAGALGGGPAVMVPLPAGSTNVFARVLGWPAAPRRALAALVPALERGLTRSVVLGRVRAGEHDRPFCINAGVGLDAETVHVVEARPGAKRRLRQSGFAVAVTGVTLRLAVRAPEIDVSIDGGPPIRMASLVSAVGAPYAYLGPRALDLVPGAAHDGSLAWLGLLRVRPHELAGIIGGALRDGRHIDHRAVRHGRAREVLVTAGTPAAVQADGEPLGWHPEVRLGRGPELMVLLPPDRGPSAG